MQLSKWTGFKFYSRFIKSNHGKENTRKIKGFVYAIIIGMLASLAILGVLSKENPFSLFADGLKKLQNTPSEKNTLWIQVVVLGLAGISVAIGFKTGLFNIGVSGQMIAGGFTAGYIALSLGDKVPNGLGQVLVLFISILIASIFAGISGILKAYFRIHEVVSTIILNWIAFYFMAYMLSDAISGDLIIITTQRTKEISQNFLFRINGEGYIPALIMLIGVALISWFVVYKTTFGRSLIMVGKNPDAAMYAGVNVKLYSTYSMMFSGAIAGVLGVIVYMCQGNDFRKPDVSVPMVPLEGFNGIAISLIAFSNPIAIIPVAMFFGLVQEVLSLSNQTTFINLVIGILMFISAITIIFDKLRYAFWLRYIFKGKVYAYEYEKFINSKDDMVSGLIEEFSNLSKEKRRNIEIQNKYWETYLKNKNRLKEEIVAFKKGGE